MAIAALLAGVVDGGSAAMVSAASGLADSPGSDQPAFCEPSELVADFGLSSLPSGREAPVDGDLPFGPKTVSISVSAGPVLPIGEGVGFWLHSRNFFGRTPLHWALRHRLRPFYDSGALGAVIARGRQRVHLIHAGREVKLFLDPPPTPAFHRYEIEIVDFDGKRLALYGVNIRVERKFWDVRLGLNRAVFRPGDDVLSRIENLGTLSPEFGEAFGLQRLAGSDWQSIDIPNRSGWLLWAGWVLPGRAGGCNTLRLPHDFPAGHYRVVKEVERYLRQGRARTYHLTAPFDVIP